MIEIDFIYDADCPAADDARANLREALEREGLPVRWREWERSAPATAESMRAFGSPTILINGRDAAGIEAAGSPSCRVYQARPGRLAAVPPVEIIRAALIGAHAPKKASADAEKFR